MRVSTVRLADVLSLADSGTWGDEADEYTGSPVLRSTNIQNSRLLLEDVAWRKVPSSDRERRALADGDILVVKSSGSAAHIGKCCIFRQPPGGITYYFSNFTLRLRPDPTRLDTRWLFYWLSSALGRAELARLNHTTTGLRNLSVTPYLNQELPIRNINEQRRLADLLDKADDIRRRRRETLMLAESLVSSTFLEMFGEPVSNPKGWPVYPLSRVIVDIEAGWSANGEQRLKTPEEYGVLKVSAVTSGHFLPREHKTIAPSTIDKPIVTPRRGDLLFSRANTRELVAATCLVDDDYPTLFLPDKLWRLNIDHSIATSAYVRYMLAEPGFRSALAQHATGTSGSMLNVSMAKLRRMSAPLPPHALQADFEQIVDQATSMRRVLVRAREESEMFFESLSYNVFSGGLDAARPAL